MWGRKLRVTTILKQSQDYVDEETVDETTAHMYATILINNYLGNRNTSPLNYPAGVYVCSKGGHNARYTCRGKSGLHE